MSILAKKNIIVHIIIELFVVVIIENDLNIFFKLIK